MDVPRDAGVREAREVPRPVPAAGGRPVVEKGPRLYEGKAKIVYATDSESLVIQEFKDDATAFDGKKKGTIEGKGYYNAQISAACFEYLQRAAAIPTHYVGLRSDREMVCKRLRMLPVEVVVRNVAAGSLARRLGLEEGTDLGTVVLETYYKNDDLGDPLINRFHIRALGLASDEVMDRAEDLALSVNQILAPFFRDRGLLLVDFKLEFGHPWRPAGDGAAPVHPDDAGAVVLGDEISPDTCRFWDLNTRERLDKDRFRRDLGNVEEAYREVWRRVTGGR